jgi:L-lysine 2,3-aminomutase
VCHAYCTFCFRWPQFIGDESLKFQAREVSGLCDLLQAHPEISDVLITGGDPLVMKATVLARYIEPLLDPRFEGFRTLRIGTKSLTYWPRRFVTDADADDLLRLFERVVQSGRHLAVMMHLNHPVELSTPIVREAIRRIQQTGAVLRFQGPLLRGINDRAATWSRLCSEAVSLGIIPYYMFVERDTGPKQFFEIPLYRATQIFSEACRALSGLASTLRGPTMSASQGKVVVDGVVGHGANKAFVLHYLRARNPSWTHQPFFAKYSETATWFDQLRPVDDNYAHFFNPLHASIPEDEEVALTL